MLPFQNGRISIEQIHIMNRKYYFPLHYDGGNRGCEGIAKGTAKIIGESVDNLIGCCSDIDLDTRLGVANYVTLKSKTQQMSFYRKACRKLELFFAKSDYAKRYVMHKYLFSSFFKQLHPGDIVISTGGDMLCYQDNEVNTMTDYLSKKGIKSILWGCSMGENNLTAEKRETLDKFSLIYARETLTYDFFKTLGLNNVVCLPDPAFVLEPEKIDLPECFSVASVLGLNISNYVVGGFNLQTKVGKEICNLIEYLLKETDLHIILIPHVLWARQDDRKISKCVYDKYCNTGRVSLLDSDSYNYLQIRYVISKCRFFIGGRTHAVISAYSTCVPAIALGYSIKSKGIAKDLGLPEQLVVDCVDNVDGSMCLLDSLNYLLNNECVIKNMLQERLPEYKKLPYNIKQYIASIN